MICFELHRLGIVGVELLQYFYCMQFIVRRQIFISPVLPWIQSYFYWKASSMNVSLTSYCLSFFIIVCPTWILREASRRWRHGVLILIQLFFSDVVTKTCLSTDWNFRMLLHQADDRCCRCSRLHVLVYHVFREVLGRSRLSDLVVNFIFCYSVAYYLVRRWLNHLV